MLRWRRIPELAKRASDSKLVNKGFPAVGRILGAAVKVIITAVLIGVCTGALFALIFAAFVKNSLKDELKVSLSEFNLNQTSTLYCWDSSIGDYVVLDELSGREGKSTWINYEDIPKAMEHAAVAIEDKRFYEHYGVDWYRTTAAFGSMFLHMDSSFGGSTITQQLLKNVLHFDEVTVKRKVLEIFRALELEKSYTKEEIMEWYLNFIWLGHGCRGVQAASKEYFGKDASELSVAECACLIGITNNPSMYDPQYHPEANRKRTATILYEMLDQGYLTQSEYDEAAAEELVFTFGTAGSEGEDSIASDPTEWFTDAVIEDVIADLMELKDIDYKTAETLLLNAGYKIYTTMDRTVQDIIDDVYSTTDNIPSGYVRSATQDLQSSIVVMDPYTGDIRGLSGGIGRKEGSRLLNLATQSQRSPGSTIKPIASYSICLDRGLVMPYTVFDDSDFTKLGGINWLPNNDDFSNSGSVTLRSALQHSINTIAAQLVDMITPRASFNQLVNRLGFTSLVDDSAGGYSDVGYAAMSLGQLTNGVTVREMCQAYTPFCNEGIFTSARTYSRIEDASGALVYENVPETNVALSKRTAYYMTEMLNNAVNHGTGWLAKFDNMAVAGKTGGSSGWKDRWFIGYTPYLLGAVWTGYKMPETMGSSNPATGMWKQVMQRVHAALGYSDASFKTPDDMVRVTVCCDTGLLATEACEHDIRGDRTMTLYMEPNELPSTVCQAHVFVDICSDTYHLFNEEMCPEECRRTVSVLDTSKYEGRITLPPWFPDGHYPRKSSWDNYYNAFAAYWEKQRDKYSSASAYQTDYDRALSTLRASYDASDPSPLGAVPYVLSELTPCTLHDTDPISGWHIAPVGNFLIDPSTGFYYDRENDILIEPVTGWTVDWRTGYLINPETGEYTNLSGRVVTVHPERYTEDKYSRPNGYEPATIPDTETAPDENSETDTDTDTPSGGGIGEDEDKPDTETGSEGETEEPVPSEAPEETPPPSSSSDLFWRGN